MILTDFEILKEIETGSIVISPFNRSNLKSNSYDVLLNDTLLTYTEQIIDCKFANHTSKIKIPNKGLILQPNILYLGSTVEYTFTEKTVPFLEGKSSTGRLGISIHSTAGKGDIGFAGYWTLEISVIQPVRIYKFMPIGQLIFFSTSGKCISPYKEQVNSKYMEQENNPVASKMYLNQF